LLNRIFGKNKMVTKKIMMNRFYIVFFLFLATGLLNGQMLPDLSEQVDESVIFYTDRDVYIAGETIWFSADYLINGRKSETELSKVLYVELFNFSGQSLARNKFKIEGNSSTGNLEIPLGLQSDYYLISAYTKYQAGSNPLGFFNQPIAIINPRVPLQKFETDDTWSFKIAALLPKNIVTDQNEYALLFNKRLSDKLTEAQVVDTGGNLISNVKLYPNGLGSVTIVPEFGSKYFLKTIYNYSDTIYKPISFEKSNDLIYTSKDKSNFLVNLNLKSDIEQDYELSILSQTNEIIYSTSILPTMENPVAEVPLNKFENGVYYFLLKKDGIEITDIKAEFVWAQPTAKISVNTVKKSYKKREQVQLTIDKKGIKNSIGPVTLSVVKQGTSFDGKKLPTYLVNNPQLLASYFLSHPQEDQSVKNQVKLLMAVYNLSLHQKKKDFSLSNKSKNIAEVRGASLSGLVRNGSTKDPSIGVEIIVSILGDNPQLKIFTTDDKGEFIFALDHIEDLTNVYLTLNNPNADSLEILVLSDFMGNISNLSKPILQLDTAMRSFLQEMYVNAQLTDIYGGEISDTSENSTSIRFSEPGVSINLDDYVQMASIELVFNELVPYVRVRKRGDTYNLEVLDEKTNITYDSPLILVDDLPVFDVGEILKLHPSIVENIKVINSTYIYGDHIIKGIVLITTNTNNFGNIKLPESFTSLEFHAPASTKRIQPSVYFNEADKKSRKPDFKNTLYFTGNLMIGEEGATLNFYTPDNTGLFDVIVRGITNDGEQVYGVTSFRVTD